MLANDFSAQKDVIIARTAISVLAQYARTVFPVEESLIFSCCDEKNYKIHAHEHRVLIKHVETLLLMGLQTKSHPPKDFVLKTSAVLEMWIFNHFMKADPKVRPELIKAAQKIAQKIK